MSQARVLKLFCLVLGENKYNIFSVKIQDYKDVIALKKEIKEKLRNAFKDVDTHHFDLWKVSIPDADLDAQLRQCRNPMDVVQVGGLKLHPSTQLSSIYPTGSDPAKKCLHIIISVTAGSRSLSAEGGLAIKRKQTDCSPVLLQHWARPILPLPLLENLSAYVQAPLEEDDKVPISHESIVSLLSQEEPRSICSLDDVQRLFRSSETEQARFVWAMIIGPALAFAPPDDDGSESLFHLFWDRNIRQMLEAIMIHFKVFRGSDKQTGSGLLSPDFGVLVDGNCVFRGEEKAPQDGGIHPKTELIQKLTWTYDPAPYVLGYYAIGADVTFVAITRTSVVDLVSVDLAWRLQRLACIAYVIKLCSVITSLGNIVNSRNIPEYLVVKQD